VRRTGDAGGRLAGWLAAIAIAFASAGQAAPATEAEVKAVFLFNFSQFVAWPPAAFDSADAPLVIAVFGHDPFGSALEAAVSNERAGAHPLVIKRFQGVADITHCHILYIERAEAKHVEEILKALRRHSTLTVSDAPHAAERGVMIDLSTRDHHVHLEINLGEAEASGLTLSSKLLRPAEIVKTGDH
jgi:YfiR/HmsC-like